MGKVKQNKTSAHCNVYWNIIISYIISKTCAMCMDMNCIIEFAFKHTKRSIRLHKLGWHSNGMLYILNWRRKLKMIYLFVTIRYRVTILSAIPKLFMLFCKYSWWYHNIARTQSISNHEKLENENASLSQLLASCISILIGSTLNCCLLILHCHRTLKQKFTHNIIWSKSSKTC